MCDQLDAAYRAIEFIEAHLRQDVAVGQIAEASGYSLFHFIRTFNRVVHHTPYDYLMRRRLSEAARDLTNSGLRVIDIAQDYCFDNQESFSRAFKRMFGVQPSQWREMGSDNPLVLLPPKTPADLRFVNRTDFQPPAVEELAARTVCGLMTALDGDPQTRIDQRRRLFADLRGCFSGRLPGVVLAVVTCLEGGDRTYCLLGVECGEAHLASPALVRQTLPAGRYVKIEPVGGQRQPALNYLYGTWLPRMRLKPARRVEIEVFSYRNAALVSQAIHIPVQDR